MKLSVVFFAALLTCVHAQGGPSPAAVLAAERMAAAEPSARWDKDSLVEADFNGDGRPDFAMVGYQGDGLVLAIRASSGKQRSYRHELLRFGVGPSIEAAVCATPARLSAAELLCNPMDEPLPGCRPSRTSRSLHLSGGDCDAIHLFWDHTRHRMAWWRL